MEAALRREARELAGGYRAAFAPAIEAARQLEPHYREMVLRAHARKVCLRRRLTP
jgi:hypothetical protein